MTDTNLHGLALPAPTGRGNSGRATGAPATPPSTAPDPAPGPGPARAQTSAPGPANIRAPQAQAAAPGPPAPELDARSAAYEARIAALEAVIANGRGLGGEAPADPEAVASLAAPTSKESARKVVLPPIAPGYKANALDNANDSTGGSGGISQWSGDRENVGGHRRIWEQIKDRVQVGCHSQKKKSPATWDRAPQRQHRGGAGISQWSGDRENAGGHIWGADRAPGAGRVPQPKTKLPATCDRAFENSQKSAGHIVA
ncbi:hypothetical protein BJ912DRAFT_1112227 [Pholiota molesta]|nr:hypothetical protein BJ912DRAFT_1112227 [Pholiota molesta]